MMRALMLLSCSVLTLSAQSPTIAKQRVTFQSGNLKLIGFLFKPAGNGPFPAVIWNHGSEKNPGTSAQFDSVAAVFVPAGYVVFAPMRRGHGLSEGEYLPDQTAAELKAHGATAAHQLVVREMETHQLDDQLAGQRYLRALPYVDTTRLVVAGCSYGGIQALLGAERGAGYKAAVAISPGALSWAGSPELRSRLISAMSKVQMPLFILHPAKDASLEPGRTLDAELTRLGKLHQLTIYPATGPEAEQGHCFGGARGMHVWAADVVAWLARVLSS